MSEVGPLGWEDLLACQRKPAATNPSVWQAATGGMTAWMAKAPTWLVSAFEVASKWRGIDWSSDSDDRTFAADERKPFHELRGAEAIGSCYSSEYEVTYCRWYGPITSRSGEVITRPEPHSWHIPMIDLDIPAVLIPSSTPGHSHLVIETELQWEDYLRLLDVMVDIGLVQAGFRDAALERGETFLRLPWIRKYQEQHDAHCAVEEWLDEPEPDERPTELQTPEALDEWLDKESA